MQRLEISEYNILQRTKAVGEEVGKVTVDNLERHLEYIISAFLFLSLLGGFTNSIVGNINIKMDGFYLKTWVV